MASMPVAVVGANQFVSVDAMKHVLTSQQLDGIIVQRNLRDTTVITYSNTHLYDDVATRSPTSKALLVAITDL